MTDITKCSGEGCPIRHKCYRYTADTNPLYQAWFTAPPIVKYTDTRKMSCGEYWGDETPELIKLLGDKLKKGQTP